MGGYGGMGHDGAWNVGCGRCSVIWGTRLGTGHRMWGVGCSQQPCTH